MDKIQTICDYLSKDKTEHLYGMDGDFHRIPLHSHEVHHREKLNSIISTALKNGVGYEEVEEGLHYLVSTGAIPNASDLPKSKCYRTGIISFVNEIIYNNAGYYPFTLSISDPEALYEFYRGCLFIVVLVDYGVIRKKFSSQGLEAEILSDKDCILEIRNVDQTEGDWRYHRIARHLFGRLFAEFLSLDWLLQDISYQMKTMQQW